MRQVTWSALGVWLAGLIVTSFMPPQAFTVWLYVGGILLGGNVIYDLAQKVKK